MLSNPIFWLGITWIAAAYSQLIFWTSGWAFWVVLTAFPLTLGAWFLIYYQLKG